jgi:hypothetical protein
MHKVSSSIMVHIRPPTPKPALGLGLKFDKSKGGGQHLVRQQPPPSSSPVK